MTRDAVVVGVDGSRRSDAAVLWAADEAAARGCDLLIVHAADTSGLAPWTSARTVREELRELGKPIVDDAVKLATDRQPELPVQGRVLVGAPIRILLIMSRNAELVVVGRDGRGALARAWLGSVTERLLAESACPAVSVGLAQPPSPHDHIERVVIGCAEDDVDAMALAWGFDVAARRRLPVLAVHALAQPARLVLPSQVAPTYDEVVVAAEHELQERLDDWQARYPDVEVKRTAPVGKPGDVLPRLCRPHDLLVLAHHHHRALSMRQLGANTTAALRAAECSTVVVHRLAEDVRRAG